MHNWLLVDAVRRAYMFGTPEYQAAVIVALF
jgi:hypothetical protein